MNAIIRGESEDTLHERAQAMAVESAFLQGARIIVLGAGAVGSVTAYRLAQAGANVTIIEKRYPGSGTTGNSFAWLNSFNKDPRPYHRLNARSIREHRDLAMELGGDWLQTSGGLAWESSSDHARANLLKEKVRRLRQLGYRVEELSPEQVTRDLDPDLAINPDEVDYVYYTPLEGWVNGVGLCHSAVSEAVRRYGARLVIDTVTGFQIEGGAIAGANLECGDVIPADAIINATGPEAPRMADLAGAGLPVTQQPGMLITTRPAPINLRCVIHTNGLAARSEGGSRLMIHSERADSLVEHDTNAVTLSDPFIAETLASAAQIIPNLRGIDAEGIRVGVRPMPKDGLPIIGFDPEVTGFYHLVMHSGVTLSAVVGGLVLEDLMDLDPPELEIFRPDRFGGLSSTSDSSTDHM
jgi:glycine/D-amino acid oxidase-like deaminating enzyme